MVAQIERVACMEYGDCMFYKNLKTHYLRFQDLTLIFNFIKLNMSDSMDGHVIDWQDEAQAVIRDVGFALKKIEISPIIPHSQTEVYFNIETREGKRFCVELSSYGFKVVADRFDEITDGFQDQTYYETPYALFDKYSVQFRECFAAALEKKLRNLSDLS